MRYIPRNSSCYFNTENKQLEVESAQTKHPTIILLNFICKDINSELKTKSPESVGDLWLRCGTIELKGC